MNIELILTIVWLHWLADFVFQSHWMASNKSKRLDALLIHIAVYTATLCVLGWRWALLNGALHFITDFVTSRWSSRLWAKGEMHNFFVVIGLDQAIHLTCLMSTASLIDPVFWP